MKSINLLDKVRSVLRVHHYSLRTEQAYIQWIKRYINFHKKRHPCNMGDEEITAFLSFLATKRNVAASTQNQALSAILFLYKKVLCLSIPYLDEIVRAKRPARLPIVLTRSEVYKLHAYLLYGTGMRLMEMSRLRIKDINFDYSQIIIRGGKGNKDRITMIPTRLVKALRKQIEHSRNLYEHD